MTAANRTMGSRHRLRLWTGFLTAALLLPVPLYATADVLYNSGTWTLSDTNPNADPFSAMTGGVTGGSGFGTPILTFQISKPATSPITDTVTLTSPNFLGSPGGALVPPGGGVATATWSTLGDIYNISGGEGTTPPIKVVISFGSNNMFSGSYTSMPNPDSLSLGNGIYQIRVTFTFTNATFSAYSTPWTLTFN